MMMKKSWVMMMHQTDKEHEEYEKATHRVSETQVSTVVVCSAPWIFKLLQI